MRLRARYLNTWGQNREVEVIGIIQVIEVLEVSKIFTLKFVNKRGLSTNKYPNSSQSYPEVKIFIR